jgi:glucose-6-phosphate isomerase
MQESASADPGRCFAIKAVPGDIVVVPPGWAHATISADWTAQMTFGALCDQEYGFEYTEIRRRRGLAWRALIGTGGAIKWEPNPAYRKSVLTVRGPRQYGEFGIRGGMPLYRQVQLDADRFQWVSKPALAAARWPGFAP